MKTSNFDSDMSSGERDALTSDYDFLQAATQYFTSDGFSQNVPRSIDADQEQSSSTLSYPPASAFQSPAHLYHNQNYMMQQRRNDDTTTSCYTTGSGSSVNGNSQMSTWTPSFISHYMIPWQQPEEEKRSSWDEESDEEDAKEGFRDEPNEKMNQRSDDSVVSKGVSEKSSRKSPGLCDILCMEIEIPIRAAYGIVFLVFSLVGLCFVIGYQSEKQVSRGRTSIASMVLAPVVAPPTPTWGPTTLGPTAMAAMPSPSPSLSPTAQPTQCENKLSVDKSCYVAGDDGILVEFDVCNNQDSDWVGIYPVSTTMLTDDYAEWAWSCGTKLCRANPKTNDFVISTERLTSDGLYRAYYMRYNNDGTPFASVTMSETFQISSTCT